MPLSPTIMGTYPKKLDRFEVEDFASLRGPGLLVRYEGELAAVTIACWLRRMKGKPTGDSHGGAGYRPAA